MHVVNLRTRAGDNLMIGKRLKQARILAHKTQRRLADDLRERGVKTSAQAISRYERGVSFPDASFLLGASDALEVSSIYLLHQPKRSVSWMACHSGKRLRLGDRERVEAYSGDIVDLQLELREVLLRNSQQGLPTIAVETPDDAEGAAEHLRREWQVGDRPIDNLVQVAEDRGLVVVDYPKELDAFDGLSGWCDGAPVAVVNTTFPADRLRFALAHEIGHLVMCADDPTENEEEALAYRFAAALLIPAEHARNELGKQRQTIGWDELGLLKRKYGVSMAVWARRASDLGILTTNCYKRMAMDLSQRGWSKREPREYDYKGDETPLELEWLTARAVAEGLVSIDWLDMLDLTPLEPECDLAPKNGFPSATELMKMAANERQHWMEKMYMWARDEDFEVFEAYGEEAF